MRWIRRLLFTVLILVIVVAGTVTYLVQRPFPTTEGTIEIPGLEGSVEVIRDVDGVPHIYASSVSDLFMAQGFVHAQDRFWQMDFSRHIGSGRVAELFGESQLDADVFLRTLGWAKTAEAEYAAAGPEMREVLDSYAAGVNAFLEGKGNTEVSFEYAVLALQNRGYEIEPWTPVNTLTWGKVMAWDLRANLDEEINRAVLSALLPIERVEQLYPPYPEDHPLIAGGSPSVRSHAQLLVEIGLEDVADKIAAVDRLLGPRFEGIGSNNWVVAGSRTASGAPLLANDPHLGIQMPSIWYEVGLHCLPVGADCPYEVVGFGFAGTPGVVIGHNARIAWGVTNQGPDSQDLYVERVNPANPHQYEVNGEWVDMVVTTEVIEVAGSDPVEIEIRTTRHGPIISGRFGQLDDLSADGAVELPDRYDVALRWTALEPSSLFEALVGVNQAGNWAEFRAALSRFDIAAQNFVYADVDGHIGYQSTGKVPIRASGDGRYPVPGWTDEFEWIGYVDFEDMPSIADPERGYILTANQPLVDASHPVFIGIDHAYGYRAKRIDTLLRDLQDATVEDMQRIQFDTYDGSAAFLVPLLLAAEPETESGREVQQLLAGWSSLQMDADSPAAAAYAAVWRTVLATTFDDELPEDRRAGGNGRFFETVRTLAEQDKWWDDASTPAREDRRSILAAALDTAGSELSLRLGADPSAWRWGDLHTATFENQTFGRSGIAPLEAMFNRTSPAEVGGGSAIVNATSWLAHDGYEVVAMPSLRMVVDLADLTRSVAVHTTGQSGHVFSRHYFDQNALWLAGQAHEMRWDRAQVVRGAKDTLSLIPGG